MRDFVAGALYKYFKRHYSFPSQENEMHVFFFKGRLSLPYIHRTIVGCGEIQWYHFDLINQETSIQVKEWKK